MVASPSMGGSWPVLLMLIWSVTGVAARQWLSPTPASSSLLGRGSLGEGDHESLLIAAAEQEAGGMIKVGMVITLSMLANGKGCNAHSGVCNVEGGSVYRVVDAGTGFIGLAEGSAPFRGAPSL